PLSDQAKQFMAQQATPEVSVHDSIVGENGMIASADTSTASSDEDEDEDQGEAGAVSLFPNFSLDRNIVMVTVVGGPLKGSGVSVRVYPPIASVVVSNHGSSSAPATFRTRRVGRGRHKRTIRTM